MAALCLTWAFPGQAEVPREEVGAALARLERGWVANRGQWDERAAFAAPGHFGTTWVTREGELRHVLSKREECEGGEEAEVLPSRRGKGVQPCPVASWVIAERFVGGQVQALRGEEELVTKVSYFLGNDPAKHRSGLATYRYLSLGEVWPGVEVKLKASQKTVEKLFFLAPGADVGQVRVEVRGAKGLRLAASGEMLVATGLGEVQLSRPVAWQERGGERVPVEVAYRALERDRYGFEVRGHDPRVGLVIDPILQSTYLGESGEDYAQALALATTGEVYVAGRTSSNNFPNTTGGAQASHGGGYWDAFVARLNSTLTANLQSTFLGGSGADYAYALAVAASGEVVMAGYTHSTDFPNTAGGAQSTSAGNADAFVARLNSTLTSNLQSTYLGGSDLDIGRALALTAGGEVVVAGYTGSNNFPNTAGGAQTNLSGPRDAFVARLNSTLTSNLQSTYLGGSGEDRVWVLAVAASGEVVVAGETSSSNFPNTTGGAQASYGGGSYDGFVARLNSTLTFNLQSTYLGGSDLDIGRALALTAGGEVVVAGYTGSNNFPNTAGGAQTNLSGPRDAFVARLNGTLTSNLQSTYLGGSGEDRVWVLALAASGEVVVAGETTSSNFPNAAGGAQASYGGGSYDSFVARLNGTLTSNPQSTYLGGSGFDVAYALTLAAGGEAVVAGYTESNNFPNTTGGAQSSYGGGGDAFVARLSAGLAGALVADMVANTPAVPPSLAPGGSYSLSFSCTNNGLDPATNATCAIAVSAGTVSGVSCTPAVPVASLPAGGSISCTYTFTAPGTPGGGDTPETGVTFTVTAGADNDSNAANNTATNAGGPVPIVDARNDAASVPGGTVGATFNLAANDQVGTGAPPGGSSFTYLGGSCTGASVNATTGVATFNVPFSGTCTVNYRLCYISGCDTATLTATPLAAEPIPTLDERGLLALLAALAAAGVWLVRQLRA